MHACDIDARHRALGHILYFDECVRSMRKAFGNHKGTCDQERQDILDQACEAFTDMSIKLKQSVEQQLLQLLETLPLKRDEDAAQVT
jgi:hypothetical protein